MSAPGPGGVDPLRRLRHDLRTPINHILGYTEILIEDAPGAGLGPALPAAEADLRRVHLAGRELLGAITTLLDPSKHSGGVDIAEVCHQLRTPIDQILGYAQMLHEEAEDRAPLLVPDLERIEEAAEILLALVQETLAPSGVPSDTVDLLLEAAVPGAGTREVYSLEDEWRHGKTLSGSVLVVDDVADNRELLTRRLIRLGCSVSAADDGPSALALLRDQPVDLVLLDLMMPGMDGFEVLAIMKSSPPLQHIPVIVLSALEEIDQAVRCVEMGAEDFLPKPFNRVLLLARVAAALDKKHLRDLEVEHLRLIDEERRQVDRLLSVILPPPIAAELKRTGQVAARRHEEVAVLFCDVVGFTAFCDSRPPEEVVPILQELVARFEAICLEHGLLKIKTIGDAFMATCGLLEDEPNPVLSSLRCGVAMASAARDLPAGWDVRVGIHLGPVVAGIMGERQFQFDVWGDTVNAAARVESNGEAGHVTLSGPAWDKVAPLCLGLDRGQVAVKGKGTMRLVRFEAFKEA